MKLQKQLSRKVGQQKYSKFVLTISSKDIEKLGWFAGEELELEIKGKNALLKPKK
jgi:hypothetical protein